MHTKVSPIGRSRQPRRHPTHRQLSDAQKVQAGAGPDVVRLTIGLEDTADIIGDLDQDSIERNTSLCSR